MRLFISVLIITSMVYAGGIWINNTLQVSSDKLSESIDAICENVKNQDWELAQQNSRQLEKKWQTSAEWWPVILDHQEMDNIEFSLAKARQFVAEENSVMALSQLAEIKLMIEYLPAKEQVNLKNIL